MPYGQVLILRLPHARDRSSDPIWLSDVTMEEMRRLRPHFDDLSTGLDDKDVRRSAVP